VAIGADQRVGKGDAVAGVHHRRHLLQVDLVHDAVARGNNVDVLERGFGPVDEMETILVAAILDRAVLVEGIGLEAGVFDRERMVDDHDQRGLAEDIVAHHARRKPRKIQLAFALDDLSQ
jgi:hypothetical protein